MTHPVKRPMQASTSASGASYVVGRITGVVNNIAEVRLNTGQHVKVRADLTRGKGGYPRAGESWILDQPYGLGWMLAVPVGYDPTSWATPTLLGSWVNYSTPGPWTPGSGLYAPASYLLEPSGHVSLRGAVKGGTVTGTGAAGPISADIFQLPVGFRPSTAGQVLFPTWGPSGSGSILVMPDGYVRAVAGTATGIGLDGIRFLAEQ